METVLHLRDLQCQNGLSGILSAGSRRPTARRHSSSEGGTIMIKSDAQRARTLAQIEGFRQVFAKVEPVM